MKKYVIVLTCLLYSMCCEAQRYFPIPSPLVMFILSKDVKLPIYNLKHSYDLKSKHLNFIVEDDRKSFEFLFCSDERPKKKSEFAGAPGVALVKKYCDTLAYNAGAMIDPSGFTIHITLQVLGHSFKGFPVTQQAHGMCQLQVDYPGYTRKYCIDLKDDDPTSEFYRDDLLSESSIIRIMVSGAVREVVERIIADYASTL